MFGTRHQVRYRKPLQSDPPGSVSERNAARHSGSMLNEPTLRKSSRLPHRANGHLTAAA
jgi:hypothetical protein